MANARAKYLKHGMAERIEIESQLQHFYQIEDFQNTRVQELLKRLEIFLALYPTEIHYPTWPINFTLLVGFLTSQLFPILGGIKTTSELL